MTKEKNFSKKGLSLFLPYLEELYKPKRVSHFSIKSCFKEESIRQDREFQMRIKTLKNSVRRKNSKKSIN